jgi:hypothetical protein
MPTIKVLDVGVSGVLFQNVVETLPDATRPGQMLVADAALKFIPATFLVDNLGNVIVDLDGTPVVTVT